MIDHSSKLNSFDSSPKVFQLDLILVFSIALGEDISIDLPLDVFGLEALYL